MKIVITEGAVISCGDISFDGFNKFGNVKIFDNLKYNELEKEIVDTDILLCKTVLRYVTRVVTQQMPLRNKRLDIY